MTNHLDSLERLAGLRERNILTDAEFEAEKIRLLALHRAQDEDNRRNGTGLGKWVAQNRTALLVGLLLFVCMAAAAIGFSGLPLRPVEPAPASPPLAHPMGPVNLMTTEVSFSNFADCLPTSAFEQVLQQLRGAEEQPEQPARTVLQLGSKNNSVNVETDEFSASQHTTKIARLQLSQQWHGLTLLGLKTTDWEGGNGFQMIFSQSAHAARANLLKLGFQLPEVGQATRRDGLVTGIEDVAEGSALTCLRSNASAVGGENSVSNEAQ